MRKIQVHTKSQIKIRLEMSSNPFETIYTCKLQFGSPTTNKADCFRGYPIIALSMTC